MKFAITLTWSKLTAGVIILCSFTLDLISGNNTVFMFSIPFAVALITGKQIVDANKKIKKTS